MWLDENKFSVFKRPNPTPQPNLLGHPHPELIKNSGLGTCQIANPYYNPVTPSQPSHRHFSFLR